MTIQSITSDQQKQFKRFVEDAGDRALREISLDRDGLQRLIERGGEFQTHLIEGIQKLSVKVADYKVARSILGNDFISPEEVAKARKLTYNDEQIEFLTETMPSAEVLKWCKDNGYAVVAGPPESTVLLRIRDLKSSLFARESGGWFAEKTEKWAFEEKVSAKWLAMKKTCFPRSTDKTWDEQQRMLSDVERVPNAAEVAWFLTTYAEVRNKRLMDNVYTRTSDVASGRNRVIVGDFGGDGLSVDYYWGDRRDSSVGVSAARKL